MYGSARVALRNPRAALSLSESRLHSLFSTLQQSMSHAQRRGWAHGCFSLMTVVQYTMLFVR